MKLCLHVNAVRFEPYFEGLYDCFTKPSLTSHPTPRSKFQLPIFLEFDQPLYLQLRLHGPPRDFDAQRDRQATDPVQADIAPRLLHGRVARRLHDSVQEGFHREGGQGEDSGPVGASLVSWCQIEL